MAGTVNFSKPRLWVVINGDYTHDVHLSTGFSSILSQKRSSLELLDLDIPEHTAVEYPLSRVSSQRMARPYSWSPGSDSPAIPPRAPARAVSDSARKRHQPKHLRKRHSPVLETLREMRDKESEAELRSAYEAQTMAYLSDALPRYSQDGYSRWSSSSDELSDDDDLDDEPEFVLAPEHW